MKTINQRLKNICKAIKSGKLSIEKGGIKNWFCYQLNIEVTIWERNLMDGANVHIYHLGDHIGTVKVDSNLRQMTAEYYKNDETIYKQFPY